MINETRTRDEWGLNCLRTRRKRIASVVGTRTNSFPQRMRKRDLARSAFALAGLLAATAPTSAQTWTQTSAPSNYWNSVASSADGSKLVAASDGAIYTSTDSGAAWTATSAPITNWISVASSADGVKLFAAVNGGGIYTSLDSGAAWMLTSAPITNWTSVACSADGGKALAVAAGSLHPYFAQEGSIYTSSDSGTNWVVSSAPLGRWIAVASSADGNKLVAVQPFEICTSKDSGATWATTNAPGYTASIACSSAGSLLLLGGADPFHMPYGGCLLVSTNCGMNWEGCNAGTVGRGSVACSADGRTLIGAGGPPTSPLGTRIDVVQTSTNSGVTWARADAPAMSWTSVASSADGGKLVAVVGGGGIWTFQSMPAPKLNITCSGSNVVISWIVPSIAFALQQNSDSNTTNWTDTTNTPTLNVTNLQNQVVVPLPTSTRFYRLKQ